MIQNWKGFLQMHSHFFLGKLSLTQQKVEEHREQQSPDLGAALLVQLDRHECGCALLCDTGMSALPEEVGAPLAAGVGMSRGLSPQVLQT